MITRRDVEEEIQRIESGPPTMQACERLAVLYFVRDHIGSTGIPAERAAPEYSACAMPDLPEGYIMEKGTADTLRRYGDSDFLAAVNGQKSAEVMAVMDELMTVILAIQPQLYRSVMRKIGDYKHA